MGRKAFTLIELLVVIAIIALLLAIIMPALGKIKEMTRTLVCRTNIRSLTLGFRTYVESNDQSLLNHGKPNEDENLWLLEIQEQFDIDKARYCPETEINAYQAVPDAWDSRVIGASRIRWIWPFDNDNTGDLEQGSYGHNFWLYGD